MPKIVDHGERREEIIRATWRVIHRVGLQNVTMKLIAQETGYSTGVLSHYFANKSDIVLSSHQKTFADLRARVELLLSEEHDAMTVLSTIVDWMLPVDDQRLFEAVVEINYWSAALSTPQLIEVRTHTAEVMLHEWFAPLVARLRAERKVETEADDETLAKAIMVFIDGVSAYSVLFPEMMSADEVRRQGRVFLRHHFRIDLPA